MAGPIGHDIGNQIGYSGTIAVKLSAARGYLDLADKKEWKKSRKLRGYIDSISSLTRQLGLEFLRYSRLYYGVGGEDSRELRELRRRMLDQAAQIKVLAHSFAKDIGGPD